MAPEVVTVVRGAALGGGHAAAAHGAAPPSTPGRGHATPTLPARRVPPGPDPEPTPPIHRPTPRDHDPDPDQEQGRGHRRFNGDEARQAFLIKEGLQGKKTHFLQLCIMLCRQHILIILNCTLKTVNINRLRERNFTFSLDF